MLHAFLLIVVGLAGDPEHGELFHKWGGTLAESASHLGVPADHLIYLVDEPTDGEKHVTGKATLEEINKSFDRIVKQATADDTVYVVLIGHGSYDGKTAKFNLPGPDVAASDFAAQFRRLPTKQIVFVNTASSSGPFMAALAAPGRTIVTATRTGAERFATLFGGFFADALAGTEADADKNRRVSVLEAFLYAKHEVEVAYEHEGIMLTEHALISDNGDREGTQTPAADGKVGRVASLVSLGTSEATDPLPTDPKLRALYTERRDIERRIEALKLLKDSMDPAKYSSELERLATDLALKTRQIRELEGKLP